MANWCYNFLQFEGNSKAVNDVMALFREMERREKSTAHGQLPDFITEKEGYMSSFNCYEDNVSEGTWLFEGEVYQSDFEILDILLERKKKLPV